MGGLGGEGMGDLSLSELNARWGGKGLGPSGSPSMSVSLLCNYRVTGLENDF